ncbi:MAG: phosphate ABC transporter permease PstA [Candidatus Geothermincolia bacterium]
MKGRRADKVATIVFWILGMIAVVLLGFIIIEIFARGLLTALNPKFFFGKPEAIKSGGGIFPMIVSSLYLVVLSLIISLPISIGAAIYLSEYAKNGRLTKFIRSCLDTLATLPSIVFGLFGMALFVIYFSWSYCLIAGACTLAILNLPILLRGTEEAIKLVPKTYREASMSLGASKWTTIRQVVIPSAMPGILTATILPIGRIIGESAAIIYTTGLFIRTIPLNPFDTAAPLAGYVWYAQTEGRGDYYRIVNGGAALLLLMVLVIYFVARYAGKKYQEKRLLGG